jgi:plasmid stability protein
MDHRFHEGGIVAVNLSIKGVPDALAETLRLRALANHRSLQGELMAIIEAAAHEATARAGPGGRFAGARTLGSKSIEQVAAEVRAQRPQSQRRQARSVDLIREMRDRG